MLKSAPNDVQRPLRNKGGASEWLHKGVGGDGAASIEAVITGVPAPLRYRIRLEFLDGAVSQVGEQLETRDPHLGSSPFPLLLSRNGRASFKLFHSSYPEPDALYGNYQWGEMAVAATANALPVLRGNPHCRVLSEFAQRLEGIHLFQGWTLGAGSPVRLAGEDAGLPGKRVVDHGQNLGVVLHRLRQKGEAWTRIRDSLHSLYPQIDDVETSHEDHVVKFWLREQGLSSLVPPSRISDGTLRWLSLLCLLLDPEPPPLLCIEEPEIGLHPDLLFTLAGLLREAAERTQLVVTTHSELLVSEFSDRPEDVVVCERERGATTLRRLEPDKLDHWLEDYRLGEVWRRGAIGGTRW